MAESNLDLLNELKKENVWWQTNEVPNSLARDFKRSDYYHHKKLLENDKINVLIGPRQVGKSTIIYQLIQYLLKEKKIPANRILFLSLERSFFALIKNPIEESIKVYEEYILKESVDSIKEPIYLFIDEASRHTDWAVTLKRYIDLKYNFKYFVSGSSSPALYQKGSESLVGRKNDVLIFPLKFRDVFRYQQPKVEGQLQLAVSLRSLLKEAIEKSKPEIFFKPLLEIYVKSSKELETLLQINLKNYMLKGGYPEFYDKGKSWEESANAMRTAYFEAIISYDIIQVFNSRNPELLRRLYIILATNTADIISVTNILQKIGNIARVTLDEYFNQLQQTHLISTSLKYKKDKKFISNDLKKVYVQDVGMRNAILGVTERDMETENILGPLAETIACDHLRRLKFNLESNSKNEIFFWKDSSRREVDFILELWNKVIPIEVKFQESIKSEDIKPLSKAIGNFDSPFGILLTKNSINLKDKIVSIPLWLFLLIC